MLADDRLREGRLDEALSELQAEVRRNPANAKYRIFLFQLLSVLGQLDRAANQLAVIADLDAASLPMVQTYRTALECEALRRSVFAGDKTPLLFGDPEDWIAGLLQALQLTARGRHAEAEQLRGEALDKAPATSGSVDGQAFEWIADADSRLGPMCEAIIDGKYYWIPFHRLKLVAIEPPQDLRDIVWMPARLTFANSGETVALIPARYPGSEEHAESAVRLARKTLWNEVHAGTFLGFGQRMFATDVTEYPLMEVRRIELNPGAPS